MGIFKLKYWPFWIVGILGFVLNYLTEWVGDPISYQYIFQPDNADVTADDHIKSIRDIFVSQHYHFIFQNGRVWVHVLVQLFCGLLGKFWFALLNAVVWGLLPAMLIRTAGEKINGRNAIVSSMLTVLLFYYIYPDPAFQINYLWVALVMVGFLQMFTNRSSEGNAAEYILISILGLLAGNGNEAFTFAAAVGIVLYIIERKFQLRGYQWLGLLFFIAGGVVLLIAPSNWARLEHNSMAHLDVANRIEMLLPALIIPAIMFFVWLSRMRGRRNIDRRIPDSVLWVSILASYVLCLILKGASGARVLIPGNMFMTMLLLRRVDLEGISRSFATLSALAGLAVFGYTIYSDYELSELDRNIYARYAESENGTVYLPDDDMERVAHRYMDWEKTYRLNASYRNPGKPDLLVLPESLREIGDDSNNQVVKLSEDAYLLIRNSEAPATFMVHKVILPHVVAKRMNPRRLVWDNHEGGIMIDSTANRMVGLYVNPRKYIKAEVVMRQHVE